MGEMISAMFGGGTKKTQSPTAAERAAQADARAQAIVRAQEASREVGAIPTLLSLKQQLSFNDKNLASTLGG